MSGIATHYSLAWGLLVCAGFFALATLTLLFMPQVESDMPASAGVTLKTTDS